MDDGAKGWLYRTAQKHYWRVSQWYDLDDLIQEGYASYAETMQRYPTAVTGEHKMALFKMVFMSRITDLANKRTKSVSEVCLTDLVSDDSAEPTSARAEAFLESLASDPDITEAVGLLSSAPDYVRAALALFTTEAGLSRLRSSHRHTRDAKGRLRRETLNERLCRLTGYDPKVTDITGALRACLTE